MNMTAIPHRHPRPKPWSDTESTKPMRIDPAELAPPRREARQRVVLPTSSASSSSCRGVPSATGRPCRTAPITQESDADGDRVYRASGAMRPGSFAAPAPGSKPRKPSAPCAPVDGLSLPDAGRRARAGHDDLADRRHARGRRFRRGDVSACTSAATAPVRGPSGDRQAPATQGHHARPGKTATPCTPAQPPATMLESTARLIEAARPLLIAYLSGEPLRCGLTPSRQGRAARGRDARRRWLPTVRGLLGRARHDAAHRSPAHLRGAEARLFSSSGRLETSTGARWGIGGAHGLIARPSLIRWARAGTRWSKRQPRRPTPHPTAASRRT